MGLVLGAALTGAIALEKRITVNAKKAALHARHLGSFIVGSARNRSYRPY